MSLLFVTLAPDKAVAVEYDCTTEEQVFAQALNQQPQDQGVFVQNMVRDTALDSNCLPPPTGHSLRWSTAHMRAPNSADWAEVGWKSYWSPQQTSHVFDFFWETGEGYLQTGGAELAADNYVNTWMYFKVLNVGSDVWKFYIDYNRDGQYEYIQPPNGARVTNMTLGWPQSETGRRGATVYYDHFSQLKYKSPAGVWYYWSGVFDRADTDYDYHCHKDASTEYEVHTPNTDHLPGSPNYCG